MRRGNGLRVWGKSGATVEENRHAGSVVMECYIQETLSVTVL